jgi:hypothetical protein
MSEAKYISVGRPDDPLNIFIFSPHISHVTMWKMVNEKCPGLELTGAGFFTMENGDIVCYGKSLTLDKTPHERDNMLIEQTLGIFGRKSL